MAGAKVSQFDLAGTIVGDELVGIIQDNECRRTTAADIAALAVGSAATVELIIDTIGAAIIAGTGITVDFDDGTDTITISNSAAYSDELAQDAIGTILTDNGLAVVTYTDATPAIDINVPAASAGTTTAGTSATEAVTPEGLAGSNFGKAIFPILVTDPAGSALTTGDGKAYFPVPPELNGMNLVNVYGALTEVSTSGIPTFQVANVTDGVDMLSTKLTIDANELTSYTAAAAVVIDGTKDDVATGDLLRIDCDVSGTDAKGVMITLVFQLS